MALTLSYAAHSEVGLVRTNNQDSAYVSPRMLMVADGMGGAAAGDLASAVATWEIERTDAHLSDRLAAARAEREAAGETFRRTHDPCLNCTGPHVGGRHGHRMLGVRGEHAAADARGRA